MELLSYLLKVIIYSALLWITYRAFLSRNGLHRLNRIFLLLAMVLPLVLPFVVIPTASISADNILVRTLPEIVIGGTKKVITTAPEPVNWLPLMYLAIAGILLGRLLMNHVSFRRKLSRYDYQQEVDYQLFLNTGMGPGSYGHKVFLPANVDDQILAHELAHIRFGHHRDLLLIQVLKVICWPNIFLHFIARDLKLVHEYEADALAANNNAHSYIQTLLGTIFGIKYQSLSHSFFHHPIKNRIMMLQKQSSFSKRVVTAAWGLFTTITLVGGTIWLQSCNKEENTQKSDGVASTAPMAAKGIRRVSSKVVEFAMADGGTGTFVSNTEKDVDKMIASILSGKNAIANNDNGPDKNGVYKYVGQMPEFVNGDISVWLGQNTNYPEAARKAGKEGRVIITFVVNAIGKIEDVAVGRSSKIFVFDEEAVRVVKAMPSWKPGMNKGKPVKVQFSLPITFKLD